MSFRSICYMEFWSLFENDKYLSLLTICYMTFGLCLKVLNMCRFVMDITRSVTIGRIL